MELKQSQLQVDEGVGEVELEVLAVLQRLEITLALRVSLISLIL